LIAAVNIAILVGIVKVFREMKTGRYDEAGLERQLDSRGLMNRLFGRLAKAVTRPRQMYPVGMLFGLGFDTASEVALLVIAGSAGAARLPWYAMLSLPILFAAGMSLMDSIDGSFMNFAYGWALSKPVRKGFYNLTITGLSVAVALVIGTIEVGGLISSELDLSGSFWRWFENVDINVLGFVIVAMFLATWTMALVIWRFARIEERWSAHLENSWTVAPKKTPTLTPATGPHRAASRTPRGAQMRICAVVSCRRTRAAEMRIDCSAPSTPRRQPARTARKGRAAPASHRYRWTSPRRRGTAR